MIAAGERLIRRIERREERNDKIRLFRKFGGKGRTITSQFVASCLPQSDRIIKVRRCGVASDTSEARRASFAGWLIAHHPATITSSRNQRERLRQESEWAETARMSVISGGNSVTITATTSGNGFPDLQTLNRWMRDAIMKVRKSSVEGKNFFNKS